MTDGSENSPEKAPEKAPAPARGRVAAFFRRLFIVAVVLLVVAGGFAGGLYVWGRQQFTDPGPLTVEREIVIPGGEGLNAIATRLYDAGVLANPLIFRLGVRFYGQGAALRAGEFRFRPGMSPRQVMELLVSGETILHRITIFEGLTAVEMFDMVAANEILEGEITLEPEEGGFLPETYYFARGDSRDDLLIRMRETMANTLDELWQGREAELPVATPEEAVILASIVEKETALDNERPIVASVFVNRLRRGMRLQSDPTVSYGLTLGQEPLGRSLTRSDLQSDTPYNTYIIGGLPPGPIASPGRASIEAVLHPAETGYLYFVADGSGGHAFASTNDEHNRNVARWRRFLREQQQ